MILLKEPSLLYEEQIIGYRKAFIQADDSLDGTSNLAHYHDISEWLAFLDSCLSSQRIPKNLVPAATYLAVREDDNQVVGMVNLRYELNDYLLMFGGHIGYSVLPQERQKGYAKQILRQALIEYRKLGFKQVLITCDSLNVGSRKTIIANGGKFENEVKEGCNTTQRYWLTL